MRSGTASLARRRTPSDVLACFTTGKQLCNARRNAKSMCFPLQYTGGAVVHHAPCQPQRTVAVSNENDQAHIVRTIALSIVPFYNSCLERERERERKRTMDCVMNSRLITRDFGSAKGFNEDEISWRVKRRPECSL